jgi:FKBP-type peptidyl-prolyl cis-trans isomerase
MTARPLPVAAATPALAALALAALLLGACGYPAPAAGQGPAAGVAASSPSASAGSTDNFSEGDGKTPTRFPDGLQIIDLKIGTGPSVGQGDTIQAQYTGWLANGTVFDSSRPRGTPLCAILSSGAQGSGDCTSVIPGWNEGIPGMKVGGRRKLIIPPALAYGSQGASPQIPPNATLTFTVEVVGITAQATATPAASPSASASPTSTPSPSR